MTRTGRLIAAAAALVYLALVGPQLNRPLMYDDANFALAAKAVADTGLPYGNQGWMSDRGDFSQREQWALWHPPLYVYLLGLLTKLGGWTPPVLRVIGVIGGLATGALTYMLAMDLTRAPPDARDVAGGVAAALVFTSPLIVQSTLIVDIDLALLLPLTLLFILLYLRLESSARWPWLVPLFALLLWSKMTNPIPLILVACIWQALRRRLRRAALHLAAIGVGGALTFGVSWIVLGGALGFPLDMPFVVNLVQWQDSSDMARRAYASTGAFVEGLQPSVLWLSPGLVAFGLVGCAVRGAQLARGWSIRHVDLVIGFVAVLVLGYVSKSAGWFPKYQVAMAPLLAAAGAPLIAQAWCAQRGLSVLIGALTTLAAVVVESALASDDWALQRTWAITPAAGAWLGAAVVAAIIAGLPRRAAAATAVAALAALAIGWSVGIDLRQVRVPYSTDYWYGTTGVTEAASWVDAHLQPGQTYVAAKEVAIRSADLRYVDQDNLVYFLSLGRPFDGTWAGEPVHALVTWQREAYVADVVARGVAAAGFREAARFGDYVAYVPGNGS